MELKCLIIAAGRGSRLSNRGDSKPLITLLGLSIIERIILTAKKGGIKDFYVVTGYNGNRIRAFLDELRQRRGIKISHIINDDWDRGNGISILKARDILKENFILLMGDHIFDEEIIRRLKNEKIQADEVILAVDYKINKNSLVDPKDVTKVSVVDDRVSDIGKDIVTYNAYDTGIFFCSPVIFTAIEASIERYNDDSLSGGIRLLAQQGKVKIFDIKDSFWIDIDDERAFQKANKCLTDKLKKASDGPISKFFNRPISIRITRYLLYTGITPNQMSFFSFTLSLIAAGLFFLEGYTPLVIGAVLAQISSIVDGCDGEIARLKYSESDFGGWFDAVLDRYADAFMLFGLTYHTFAYGGDIFSLIIGFFAIIGSFMNSYTADKYDGLMKKGLGLKKDIRVGRDTRIFLIFVCGVINLPLLALLLIALVMNLENMRRVVVCYKYRCER